MAKTATKAAQQTPQQIDTVLAVLYDQVQTQARIIHRAEERLAGKGFLPLTPHARLGYLTEVEDANVEIRRLNALAAPGEREYRVRQWSRYFLVTNGNGHVHRERNCSTCYPTTQYAWLPALSGCDERAAVAEHGEKMCTVCFPDAPSLYQALGRLSRTAQVAADAKAARQAKRDEAAAKKVAKAITNPDGTVLRGSHWRIETLAAAKHELLSIIGGLRTCVPGSIVDTQRAEYEASRDRIAAAIAHKIGTTTDAVLAEFTQKSLKRGW